MLLKDIQRNRIALNFLSVSFVLAVAFGSLLVSPCFAQTQKKPAQAATGKTGDKNPLARGPETAPYDKDLFRLSELLGALGYLYPLCTGSNSSEWSDKIQILADSEGKMNSKRHDLITGAYNKGFRNYTLTYQSCTQNAQSIIANYISEAEKISKLLSSRYGG